MATARGDGDAPVCPLLHNTGPHTVPVGVTGFRCSAILCRVPGCRCAVAAIRQRRRRMNAGLCRIRAIVIQWSWAGRTRSMRHADSAARVP